MADEETRRIKDIVTTIENGRAQLSTDQTFVTSANHDGTGAVKGTNVTGNGSELRVHTVQAIVNQQTGEITYPAHQFGPLTVPSIKTTGKTDDGIHRNGFNGNIYDVLDKCEFTFDNVTKIASFSYSDESDVDITINDERAIIPHGSDLLTADPIDETYNGWYQYYFDDNGKLTAVKGTLTVPDFFVSKCLVVSLYHDPLNKGIPETLNYPGCEISMLWQVHGAGSVDWRAPHHLTERTKISLDSGNISTTSTALTPTSELSIEGGRVLDEDIDCPIVTIDGTQITSIWPVYYYEDVSDGVALTHRGPKTTSNLNQIYVTSLEAGLSGGDSNIVWTEVIFDTDGVTPLSAVLNRVEDDYYTVAYAMVGCGVLSTSIIFSGQHVYPSLEIARRKASVDIKDAYTANELLHEASLVGAVILDHLGNIVPVNDDGLMLLDLREGSNLDTFGSSGEVLVANGEGEMESTSTLDITSLTLSDILKLTFLAGSPGNVLFTGADGTIGSISIFGTGGGSGPYDESATSGTITVDTDSPLTSIGLSHTTTAELNSGVISYSLDIEAYSNTNGVFVEIWRDSTLIDSTEFDGVWGPSITLSKTISIGVTALGSVFDIRVGPDRDNRDVIINTGSFDISGSTSGGDTGAFFVEASNGYGTGLHTFEGVKTTGQVVHEGMPTSATGLSSGQLWNDGGTVKVA